VKRIWPIILLVALAILLLPLTARVSKTSRLQPASGRFAGLFFVAPRGEGYDLLVQGPGLPGSPRAEIAVTVHCAVYDGTSLIYTNSSTSDDWHLNTTWLADPSTPAIVLTSQPRADGVKFGALIQPGRVYSVVVTSSLPALTNAELWLHWWGRPKLF
jgi:hypothetical protein